MLSLVYIYLFISSQSATHRCCSAAADDDDDADGPHDAGAVHGSLQTRGDQMPVAAADLHSVSALAFSLVLRDYHNAPPPYLVGEFNRVWNRTSELAAAPIPLLMRLYTTHCKTRR